MIQLSATSIKDFVECEMRHFYKLTSPETVVPTKEMLLGTAMHSILEKEPSGDMLENIVMERNKLPKDPYWDKLYHFHNIYLKSFEHLPGKQDIIESSFAIPYDRGVVLAGRFDRIIPQSNIIIDWKTSTKPAKTLSNEIQAIIYNYAYTFLYKTEPKIYFAYLNTGDLVEYTPDKTYTFVLFDEIIPNMIKTIKRKDYTHNGLMRYFKACTFCTFRPKCYEDLGISNELDSI